MISRTGLPARDTGLDVLHVTEGGLRDRITLVELSRVLTNERAEGELWAAEVSSLECVRADKEDSELLCVVRARVDELTAERALLTAKTVQEIAEGDTLAARIGELEVTAATRNGELAVMVRAAW